MDGGVGALNSGCTIVLMALYSESVGSAGRVVGKRSARVMLYFENTTPTL